MVEAIDGVFIDLSREKDLSSREREREYRCIIIIYLLDVVSVFVEKTETSDVGVDPLFLPQAQIIILSILARS